VLKFGLSRGKKLNKNQLSITKYQLKARLKLSKNGAIPNITKYQLKQGSNIGLCHIRTIMFITTLIQQIQWPHKKVTIAQVC